MHGIDKNPNNIEKCRQRFPNLSSNLITGGLHKMEYKDFHFDHIISSAVLHFCNSEKQFVDLIKEHIRVLKSGGTLFIRMTSEFGLNPNNLTSTKMPHVFILPDKTTRFLITYDIIDQLTKNLPITLKYPPKTVNVHEQRAMAVLVFQKK
jgi:ubiquinone/menaquinone biosynthesis C-methylase UbiE